MKLVRAVARKIFGTQNDRELKSLFPIVQRINALEERFRAMSQGELQAMTGIFKERLEKGESLDQLLPEAFAVVREGARRSIGQRHYDVQMIGGITLHKGRIAEMRTGEGKTLVATLPSFLNALQGKGVHVVTVNDYLAKRDASWMGKVFGYLGLSTGIIVHGLSDRERKLNYGYDITYGTNNEFGFDYLRDNMKFRLEDYVQRDLNYAIVDEVDSILIDEARTPLIISGPTEDSTDLYYKIDRQIRSQGGLEKENDYTVDEKSRTAALTEAGVEKMEQRLGIKNLYDPAYIETLHHVNQALRAHVLFKNDVDYVVKDGEVMIVDEFTGRLMPGRRWSDGLHQAIEAKEGVTIESENQTLATITFQNYFRMYSKLSGMTGTADTEATEFKQIYKLDVTVIPTNRPMVRLDQGDKMFKSEETKLKKVIEEIRELQTKGQPVLVGTVSVEKSETFSAKLKSEGIRHHVLNAKHHQSEAEIVAQAGRKGAVTISTNMAGRGTDILLGGNAEALAKAEMGPLPAKATPEERDQYQETYQGVLKKWEDQCSLEREEVKGLGGLFILGTERHESRRIDNQLRGRSGRQGDPGESQFYLSLDDDLMRIFGTPAQGGMLRKLMEDDQPLEHRMLTKSIEEAQRKVEGRNYDLRKLLLEYDDVMNQQRRVVYAWRREVLAANKLRPMIRSMIEDYAALVAEHYFPNGRLRRQDGEAHFDIEELRASLKLTFQLQETFEERDIDPLTQDGLKQFIESKAETLLNQRMDQLGEENELHLEKMVLLTTIDQLWKDHLLAMDHLREGVGLQQYGQKDPLIIYKKEGFRFFQMMMSQINEDVIRKLFAVQVDPKEQEERELAAEALQQAQKMKEELDKKMQYNMTSSGELTSAPKEPKAPPPRASSGAKSRFNAKEAGRNEPCPCGSGKKYKKCCGA